jgi:hypothetical protein
MHIHSFIRSLLTPLPTMADLAVYELFPRSSPMTARTGREWTVRNTLCRLFCAHSPASSFVRSGLGKSPFAALSMLSNDRNTYIQLTRVESRVIKFSLTLAFLSCGSRFLASKLLWGYYAPSCLGIGYFAFFCIPNKALYYFVYKVGRKMYVTDKTAVLAEYAHLNLDYERISCHLNSEGSC